MEINCKSVIEKILLNQNPLYAFSVPISLLIAIIMFGIAKAYKWSENSYINQILIPILTFLLIMVFIDIISRMMISKMEMNKMMNTCNSWFHKPQHEEKKIHESFISEILLPEEKIDTFMEPISEIPNISPMTLDYNKDGLNCIENSNCCSLCSENNDNPCNIIAPIPGPQWMPRKAEAVQFSLKNNEYTPSKCPNKL